MIAALCGAFGILPFASTGAQACSVTTQVYDPCEPPQAPVVRPGHYHAFHPAAHPVSVEQSCSIIVDDITPEGPWYGEVNHAQFRVEGGPNNGWVSRRFALRKGQNQLQISCAKARGANRIAVWVFGNEAKCRYVDGYGDPAGVLDQGNHVWIARN
jgi:hypothetical protein